MMCMYSDEQERKKKLEEDLKRPNHYLTEAQHAVYHRNSHYSPC
jgi:hypothetical protein